MGSIVGRASGRRDPQSSRLVRLVRVLQRKDETRGASPSAAGPAPLQGQSKSTYSSCTTDDRMDEFTGILCQGTAAIAPEYFSLPIHGGESRYRERVYCYELYHQMRSRWPEGCQYSLNGEEDKRSHPYFGTRSDAPKPDFIVHIPGTGENYAVLEVKSPMTTDAAIREDLVKLRYFRRDAGYHRALLLIYGVGPEEALARVIRAGSGALEIPEIWAHSGVGEPAQRPRS
jgi:hypothetical protein